MENTVTIPAGNTVTLNLEEYAKLVEESTRLDICRRYLFSDETKYMTDTIKNSMAVMMGVVPEAE